MSGLIKSWRIRRHDRSILKPNVIITVCTMSSHLMQKIIVLCLTQQIMETWHSFLVHSSYLHKGGWWKQFYAVAWISSKNRAAVVCDSTNWKNQFFWTQQLDGFAFCSKVDSNGIILSVFKWSVNKLPPLWSLECCLPAQYCSMLSTVTFFSSCIIYAYISCRITGRSVLGSVPFC